MSFRRGTYRGFTFYRAGEDAFPTADLNAAPDNPYQRRNWAMWHNLGRPMDLGIVRVLGSKEVFWSRGSVWDCDHCHGILRKTPQRAMFHVEQNGEIVAGWSCDGKPSGEPMADWR